MMSHTHGLCCKNEYDANMTKALCSQKGQGDDKGKSNLACDASQQLVSVALQRGTADNVTALVMLPQWS